jgi:hypothetical protein
MLNPPMSCSCFALCASPFSFDDVINDGCGNETYSRNSAWTRPHKLWNLFDELSSVIIVSKAIIDTLMHSQLHNQFRPVGLFIVSTPTVQMPRKKLDASRRWKAYSDFEGADNWRYKCWPQFFNHSSSLSGCAHRIRKWNVYPLIVGIRFDIVPFSSSRSYHFRSISIGGCSS